MSAPAPPGKKSFYKSWAFRAPLIIVVILVLLWIISEIVVPRIASSYAKREITERYPEAKDVTVTIKAFPALKLAFKKYDDLTVEVRDITLQQVNFDQVELNSEEWPLGTFIATLGQEEIARFFSLKHSYVADLQIEIDNDAIKVSGKVDVGVAVVSVEASGQLESVDGKRIFFRPQDIKVTGIKVPSSGVTLVREVMDENPVFVVRDDLPYSISKITPRAGKLVLEGEVDLEQALNIKL